MAVSNRSKLWGTAIAFIVLAVFTAANAHLFFVAFKSQPECVEHIKRGELKSGEFSAATSSC